MEAIAAGGAGLLLGLGLMVWALRERSLRHRAERELDGAKLKTQSAQEAALANFAHAAELEQQIGRMAQQLATLRERLRETRIRLARCGDPKAVKAWLDEELKAQKL